MTVRQVPGQLLLWEPPAPIAPAPVPTPAPPPAPARRRPARRHRYESGARPATRPHGYYLTRGTRTINLEGDYL